MRPVKYVWVVTLDNLKKTGRKVDRVIVRASTKEKAMASGKANSIRFRNVKSYATARIADPICDLGMQKTSGAALKKFRLMW